MIRKVVITVLVAAVCVIAVDAYVAWPWGWVRQLFSGGDAYVMIPPRVLLGLCTLTALLAGWPARRLPLQLLVRRFVLACITSLGTEVLVLGVLTQGPRSALHVVAANFENLPESSTAALWFESGLLSVFCYFPETSEWSIRHWSARRGGFVLAIHVDRDVSDGPVRAGTNLGTIVVVARAPFWAPTALLYAYPAVAFARGPMRRWRRRRRGLCIQCGYNLTGLTEPRCPECGTTYEMHQRSSQ